MSFKYPPLHFGIPLPVDSILHSSVNFAWNFIDDVDFHETVKYLKYIYIYIYIIFIISRIKMKNSYTVVIISKSVPTYPIDTLYMQLKNTLLTDCRRFTYADLYHE